MQYDQPEFQNREGRLQLELASWIYQSHLWKKGGVAEDNIVCEWCGLRPGGNVGITVEDSLCTENPKIKEMRRFWIKNTMKALNKAEEIIKESRTSLSLTNTFMSGGIEHDKTIDKKG